MISIIIIQHNNSQLTRNAIESLLKYHKDNIEIILVDNNSTEAGAIEFIKDFPDIKLVLNKKNIGFGAANNLAVKESNSEILLFLNNDVIITSEFLSKIEQKFNYDPQIGIIGPKLLNGDGSVQLSMGRLPSIPVEFFDKFLYSAVNKKSKHVLSYINKEYSKEKQTFWVTGAALFIRRNLFLNLEGFDEKFFMYFEDKDLCARLIANGFKVIYFPESSLIHLRGSSFGNSNKDFLNQKYRESQLIYYQKHRSKIEQAILKKYLKLSGKIN